MIIDILTLFPKFYESPISVGLINNAINENKIKLNIVMIMTYNIFKKHFDNNKKGYTLFFSPSGKTLTQKKIKELSNKEHITMILGHYEGIDYRVEHRYADEAVSIGDYVLSGGEIPALLIVDAISRYKGILNNDASVPSDTFEENSMGLLEYEQYTRPAEIDNMKVPEVLISGNHKNIDEYRRERSLIKTFINRADLFSKIDLNKKDLKIIFDYLKNKNI